MKMNRPILLFSIFIFCLSIIDCGGKNNPDPDETVSNIPKTDIPSTFADTVEVVQAEKFYELEKIWSELIPKEKVII